MLGFRDFFSDFLGRKSFYISERYDKIRMYTNQQQKMIGTKMDSMEKRWSIRKYKPDKIEKSVNLDTASSSSQKITNAQRNLEKLQKRPEKFKFDHGTNDKELI